MDRKTKHEQKKKKKWGKFVSSSPDVVASAAAPAEAQVSISAPGFPQNNIFSVVESIETHSTGIDTHDDASSSPPISGSSDPE
ncbi:hypothetical protein M9458_023090, partial [Cirrhinus mrigala]